MKRNNSPYYSFIIASSFVLGLCSHAVAFNKRTDLHLIKKIHIDLVHTEKSKIRHLLKSELENRGFIIVDEITAADAILSGETLAEVVVDGDGSIPNKVIYRYQLLRPTKEVVWKATVKFTTVFNLDLDDARAARKISEKLLRDWQKSARKA